MHIGISLQNNQGIEDVQSIIQLARRAEELGFASVWVHDHVFNAAQFQPHRDEALLTDGVSLLHTIQHF